MSLIKAFKWGVPLVTAGSSFAVIRHFVNSGEIVSPEFFVKNFSDNSEEKSMDNDIYLATQEDKTNTSEISIQQSVDTIDGLSLSRGGGEIVNEKIQEEIEKNKQKNRENAKKWLDKLNDYSFRLFLPCTQGTGWILDYELSPEGKYPTVWYIATVAHVVDDIRFGSNPYNQILPKSLLETQKLRKKYGRIDYSGLSLWRDRTCKYVDWYGYNDMNFGKQATGEVLKSEMGAIWQKEIEEPKLFFSAFNFLEENQEYDVPKNHFKDFVVLEIKFTNEDIARKVTGGFADKYTVDSKDAINVFSKPIEERYSWSEIENNKKNFYTLAYPVSKKDPNDKYSYKVSWNEDKALGDQLSEASKGVHALHGTVGVKGFVPTKKYTSYSNTNWDGKNYHKFGHWYLFKNFALTGGSSGGLHIDDEGNLVGIKSMIDNRNNSFLTTLRSSDVNHPEWGLKSPKYDLIAGVEGQKNSFRLQVEKYKKNTWLKARGWQHKS
ncbi:hypothetical protein OVS_03385 [Mycoplasma ovis str. Michigan]|uniref:DUF31 domain-containing protein n=1 Tax=Mycoplasma ovis str. Michigan TaxID=1415773 RepID=A0ABM5P1V4_9MOLU|nr:hypothetical protein [Mycoplasma ovis]AHC40429.1 hypothetical protein OVS_03385 [Mycoplasma ovis str. Michigan]